MLAAAPAESTAAKVPRPDGSAPCAPAELPWKLLAAGRAESPENVVSASLNRASVEPVAPAPNLDFIAKIRPVGPVIGCTPQTS